jgi:hypothetical protein
VTLFSAGAVMTTDELAGRVVVLKSSFGCPDLTSWLIAASALLLVVVIVLGGLR